MSSPAERLPIAILYEHPDWFRPLFRALSARGIPHVRLNAASHAFNPAETSVPYALVVNRASPSAYLRGHQNATFYTQHYLRHLARLGVPVVNGSAAYALELSKANQLDLLQELGLPFPHTVAINHPSQAVTAATAMRYPVLVKANVGGSGAGITSYDSAAALQGAVDRNNLELGLDGTALVQEAAPLTDGHITRVETLGGKFLYAINVYPAAGSYDLCPADACQTTGGVELVRGACAIDAPISAMRVEAASPSAQIIAQVEAISRAAHIDIGGIEYLVDARDGQHYFYDVNALSNFVADAPNVVGFDPWERFVDYLEQRAYGALGETGAAESRDNATAGRS